MEAYFQVLEQFEKDKEPLRTQLERCAHDFTQALAQQYTPKTIRKHAQLLALFIDCVCWDTDVRRLDESTCGIANSHFRQWYQRKVGDRTASELKHIPSDSLENLPYAAAGRGSRWTSYPNCSRRRMRRSTL